jgi:light-regulated signal transduction histidine kinase (bacteriophytochrome)
VCGLFCLSAFSIKWFSKTYSNEKSIFLLERLHGRSQYSGTGIGLAICKKVVEFHGGELDVKSQLDVGTTFILRLPKTRNGL